MIILRQKEFATSPEAMWARFKRMKKLNPKVYGKMTKENFAKLTAARDELATRVKRDVKQATEIATKKEQQLNSLLCKGKGTAREYYRQQEELNKCNPFYNNPIKNIDARLKADRAGIIENAKRTSDNFVDFINIQNTQSKKVAIPRQRVIKKQVPQKPSRKPTVNSPVYYAVLNNKPMSFGRAMA